MPASDHDPHDLASVANDRAVDEERERECELTYEQTVSILDGMLNAALDRAHELRERHDSAALIAEEVHIAAAMKGALLALEVARLRAIAERGR